jgi:hypothetical protein
LPTTGVVLETYDTTPPQKTGHALVCAGVSLVGGLRRQVAATGRPDP